MTVDPRMFAPADLGSIYAQGQQFRAQQEDRQLRLGELQQRTQQQGQEAARERAQVLGRLARGVRQAPLADRPALIQRLTPQLRAMGVTEEEIAGFDPSDANLDALAMMSGDREPQATGLERDYEFIRERNPELAEQFLRNRAEGAPLIANNGDGTFTIVPRNQVQGGQAQQPQPQEMTATNPQTGERIRLNPQTGQWEPIQGGPSPQGSGNFPG